VDLVLLVGCTDTKTQVVRPGLRLRDHPEGDGRLDAWVSAVRGVRGDRPLRELYGGQLWAGVRDLETVGSGLGTRFRLWIASAGLGLCEAGTVAPAYSATFSPRNPDTAATTGTARRQWWRSLNDRMNRRTISRLREQCDGVLAVLSPPYLSVLAKDLETAGAVVVTSGAGTSDARMIKTTGLRHWLGGSQLTLNTRAAGAYLAIASQHGFGTESAAAAWERSTAQRRTEAVRPGRSTSDDVICAWIAAHPSASASVGLRVFRAEGMACEQSRFYRLHREVHAA
jgi:hypothetical protein